MNPKQRYIETMTFGNPDKIPLSLGGPRESTLKRWHSEGLPESLSYIDALLDTLNIPPEALLRRSGTGVSFRMIPEFEPVVLEHKDGHYLIRDWMGAITEISDTYDETYLRAAKDFVTRKWHKFPVENREDFEEMKKRFDPSAPERIPSDLDERLKALRTKDEILSISFNGVFWQLREWCGFENLCIFMADDPDFVHEMASFWTDFVSDILKDVLKRATPDHVLISEDMAYKAHSMISPQMTREFIQPAYKQWVPLLKENGCAVIELDSDGCIDELIPIWIESGINSASPIEVAAHCDILDYRQQYGKAMAYSGGIDKRVIAKGGKELRDLVNKIVPELFKDGGYIPGCDHGVPPDVSWQNYLDFAEMIAKMSGW